MDYSKSFYFGINMTKLFSDLDQILPLQLLQVLTAEH